MAERAARADRGLVISRQVVKQRFALVVASILLLLAMNWVYVNILVGIYGETGYPGYPYAHWGLGLHVACWLLGISPVLWLPISARRPSQVLIWCMYLMIIVPTAVVGSYALQQPPQILSMLVWMIIGLATLQATALLPYLRFPAVRANRRLFWLIVGGMSVAAYAITIRTYGTTIRLVTLQEVYLQRGLAVEIGAGALARYLMSWQALVINPMLMAMGIARRRPLLFFAGIGGQVFFFAVAAQRILLATPFIVLGFNALVRRDGKAFGFKATIASAAAFTFPILVFAGGGVLQTISALLFDALLSRLYLNSGFLSVLYFKFFANHPHVGFAEVKPLNLFFHSPYSDSYPVALSYDVWGFANDPNTNLFADGFAQLGYSGLMIEALGLAFMFWLLDSIARQRKLSVWFVAMICAGQVSSVINASTSNIILGDGMALLIILLATLPMSESVAHERERKMHRAVPAARVA